MRSIYTATYYSTLDGNERTETFEAIDLEHAKRIASAKAETYELTKEITAMTHENEIKTAATVFPHLRAALITERGAQAERTAHYIKFGYMPTWAESNRNDPDQGIKQYATAHTWDQYRRGEIDRDTAEHRALKRYAKQEEKERAAELAKLDRIANAPDVEYLDISVEWKRSAAWGYNPTATAYIRTADRGRETYTGTASGCGYDKRSAAVAGALNQSNSVLKLLYTAAENALAAGVYPSAVGLATGCVTWRDILGYGSGYSILPYFEGGVGVNEFWHIFKNCGFWTRSNESGKRNDYYFIGKEEE